MMTRNGQKVEQSRTTVAGILREARALEDSAAICLPRKLQSEGQAYPEFAGPESLDDRGGDLFGP